MAALPFLPKFSFVALHGVVDSYCLSYLMNERITKTRAVAADTWRVYYVPGTVPGALGKVTFNPHLIPVR